MIKIKEENSKKYCKPLCVIKKHGDVMTTSAHDPFDPAADDIYFTEGEQNQ